MPEMREIQLKPIRETPEWFDALEEMIAEIFRKEIYLPLVKELGLPSKDLVENALEDLAAAIQKGRLTYENGRFTGKFNSTLSRELRELGAKWDGKGYKLPPRKIPATLSSAIEAGNARFQSTLKKIDARLKKVLPEEIAGKLSSQKFFDSTLFKLDRDFQKTVKGIVVPPQLTAARRAKIAEEYTNNLRLYIKDWTEKETVELRKKVQESTFSGARYENLFQKIQTSYGVSKRKAKFLARQETGLLMAKFKESRYTDSGIVEYRWTCVIGSPKHPVRPMHKALDGKVFRFDDPPVVNEKGERKNPGEDYNCRCTARPIVRF